MTVEETKKLLALIKVAYPTAYKDMDRDFAVATINMWQTTFPTVPFSIMEMAFDRYRKKSKFAPTIAEMCEEIKDLYYVAVEDVLTSKDKQIRSVGQYIMEHTKAFTDGIGTLNYGAVARLEGKNIKMLEGDGDG
ncbi:MAG: hypothetical protein J6V23_06960 [Bacteroidaceae bacterium]|nr:hypothetical protein [Bacteroidaceae bacterium]